MCRKSARCVRGIWQLQKRACGICSRKLWNVFSTACGSGISSAAGFPRFFPQTFVFHSTNFPLFPCEKSFPLFRKLSTSGLWERSARNSKENLRFPLFRSLYYYYYIFFSLYSVFSQLRCKKQQIACAVHCGWTAKNCSRYSCKNKKYGWTAWCFLSAKWLQKDNRKDIGQHRYKTDTALSGTHIPNPIQNWPIHWIWIKEDDPW